MPRKKPYTQIGIQRLKCYRTTCKNKATHQWQICADGNVYRPICIKCDIEINRMVLKFMEEKNREYKMKMYIKKHL